MLINFEIYELLLMFVLTPIVLGQTLTLVMLFNDLKK